MAQSKYRPLAETPFLEAPYDINSHPDSMREYLRINDVENERTFVVDMTFMLSRYGCMFGQCCSIAHTRLMETNTHLAVVQKVFC